MKMNCCKSAESGSISLPENKLEGWRQVGPISVTDQTYSGDDFRRESINLASEYQSKRRYICFMRTPDERLVHVLIEENMVGEYLKVSTVA